MTTETAITKRILKALNDIPGCRAQKVHGGKYGTVGRPDITACYMGLRIDLEVKRPSRKPDPKQQHELDQWAQAGGITATVHTVDDAMEIIHQTHLRFSLFLASTKKKK
jgi:hypothetical protein